MEWRKRSSDNKKIWDASEVPEIEFDTEGNWKRLQERKLKEARFSTVLRIAAGVLLAIGVSSVLYVLTLKSDETLISSADQPLEVHLPDGSRIWLNKQSGISYNETFGEGDRRVHLSGEAFFEVEKDAGRPFIIQTPNGTVEVVGTSFNLRTVGADDELVVVTGKVKMSGLLALPGERVVGRSKESPPSLAPFVSWKPKHLLFDRATLNEVINTIEVHYAINIELREKDIANCRFSGNYINADYREILAALCLTLNLELTDKGGKEFMLSGNGCN